MDFENQNQQNPFESLNKPATPAQPAAPAAPTAPKAPATPQAPAANPFMANPQPRPQAPVNPTAQPQAPAGNPFVVNQTPPAPARPTPPVTPATPAPQRPAAPAGGSYIPPVTPAERQNTTMPNYTPNIAQSFDAEEPLSVGQWMLTTLILMIPCVNIVMLFVWAFGSGNKGRANYCKATLIWAGIVLVLYIILIVVCLALGVSIMENLSY